MAHTLAVERDGVDCLVCGNTVEAKFIALGRVCGHQYHPACVLTLEPVGWARMCVAGCRYVGR